MKNAILAFALVMPSFAFATSLKPQPDFRCVQPDGWAFEMFVKYGEIHRYDETGAYVDHLDGMRVDYKEQEVFPVNHI